MSRSRMVIKPGIPRLRGCQVGHTLCAYYKVRAQLSVWALSCVADRFSPEQGSDRDPD